MKICKVCFSDIDKRAKKCPNCHSWQSKIRTIFYNPAFLFSTVLITMFCVSSYFESQFTAQVDFKDYANEINILESRTEFGKNSCGETVAIIGTLHNQTEITWKDFTYEITFSDSTGEVSDTNQKNEYSFVLPANEKVPFKVSMKKEFDLEKYNSFKIRIISAREKTWFF